jgi:thioester reductase-like protein
MTYCLLTGGTGLLGSYLLHGCLRAGHRMAVLVRPARRESARQRVEASLARWEQQTSEVLPRPVVLEGDLRRPELGLSTRDLHWVARHCHAVIHSAANLMFVAPSRQAEPWLSNVEGTRHVLELCRRCGIGQFHYVSTAYVCGLREGRILETELDLGQQMSNDYERSKLEAEKMIRSAGLAEPPTIYRPSIIVGDSRTGYTSSFHGFYAAVKLVHTLAGRMVRGSITAQLMIDAFHLDTDVRKDFVPVDWVSTVITYLLGRPEHHGKTYHLTASQPTPVAVWSAALQDAVERYSPLADPSDPSRCDAQWFEQMFRSQVEIYRPYWRDDPQFDRTHALAAAGHLPCPRVDHDMLVRMARFAIQTHFGRKMPRTRLPLCDVRGHVQRRFASSDAEAANGLLHLGLQVSGPGGGEWKLLARDGRVISAEDGIDERCRVVFRLTSDTFRRLVAREMSVPQAVIRGHVQIIGNGIGSSALTASLESVVIAGDV